jgi:hypothetical protein
MIPTPLTIEAANGPSIRTAASESAMNVEAELKLRQREKRFSNSTQVSYATIRAKK